MSGLTNKAFKFLPTFLGNYIRQRYYNRKLRKSQITEEADLFIFQQIIKEGNTAIDIGANFGLYTRFFSEFVGKEGHVYSFEPIKITFSSLKFNVQNLQLRNVNIFNLALSDSEGKAVMQVPEYDHGGKNLYEASISENVKESDGIAVVTSTLDKVIEKHSGINFIKIDVEGHEMKVLSGSKEIISQSNPLMLIEINGGIHPKNENANSIITFLKSYGYDVYKREEDKLVRLNGNDNGFNYFFLTEEHRNKYAEIIK